MKRPSVFFKASQKATPTSVFATGSSPRQSIWSYVGRAQYLRDQFPQARQRLERAISDDREENIARLYLGLTLIQLGDRQAGLKPGSEGSRVFWITLAEPKDLILDSSGIRIEISETPSNIT